MVKSELSPALQAIGEFEEAADRVDHFNATDLVHGLVQGPEYYRQHVTQAEDPEQVERYTRQRQERASAFFDRGKHLSMYVTPLALQNALAIPEQEQLMTRRRDSGLLEVHVVDRRINDESVTLYTNARHGRFGAYFEQEGATGEEPSPNGTKNTPEGQRMVVRARARIVELGQRSVNVTHAF